MQCSDLQLHQALMRSWQSLWRHVRACRFFILALINPKSALHQLLHVSKNLLLFPLVLLKVVHGQCSFLFSTVNLVLLPEADAHISFVRRQSPYQVASGIGNLQKIDKCHANVIAHLIRIAFIRECLLPLITYPRSSK